MRGTQKRMLKALDSKTAHMVETTGMPVIRQKAIEKRQQSARLDALTRIVASQPLD